MIYRRLFTLCIVLTVLFDLITHEAFAASIDCQESTFLSLINNYRQSQGLSTLSLSPALVTSAQEHSLSMSVNDYFDHTDLSGFRPWDRASFAGYPRQNVAECIYAGKSSAEDAFTSWKNSPSHNALMLNPSYVAIGVGRAYSPNSMYKWYWTTDFGDFIDSLVPLSQVCRYCSASIFGRLVNTDWQFIPGSIVYVDDVLVTTDIFDGHFEAGLMPIGIHSVYYSAPGYLPQTQILEFLDGQATKAPTCLLSPADASNIQSGKLSDFAEIYGCVVDRLNRPIKNAAVRINQTLIPTNANGEYRFTMVTQGTYAIYIDYYGCQGEMLPDVKTDKGRVSICPTVSLKPL